MAIGMSIVLKFQPGKAEEARRILTELAGPIRDEPGCAIFEVHTSKEDADVVYLYEQYADQAAVEAHLASPMFKRVEEEVFPIVADRQYNEYETVAG
jgi:quinol monooxygenase YgiN